MDATSPNIASSILLATTVADFESEPPLSHIVDLA